MMFAARSHSIKDHPGLTGLLMLSALAGAVTAVFATPRTGYESRTRLKERGRKLRDRWQEYIRPDETVDPEDVKDAAKPTAKSHDNDKEEGKS